LFRTPAPRGIVVDSIETLTRDALDYVGGHPACLVRRLRVMTSSAVSGS
jgi:hypothetical protein